MTTNAGAEGLSKSGIGFFNAAKAGDEMEEIKRMFTPEFRNRLDAIISFGALDEEVILRVVDKFLIQLENQLSEKKVEAIFTDNLKAFLAKNGFDPKMGARPWRASSRTRSGARSPTSSSSASSRMEAASPSTWTTRERSARHRPVARAAEPVESA
jgi:hypothetical protein